MKKIIMCIVTVLLLSCESNLDQLNPNNITTETFFETEDDFLQALVTTYTPLRNPYGGYYNARSVEIRNYRGDDVVTRNDTEDCYQIYLFINSPENVTVQKMFDECYSGIYRANTILEKLEKADLSEVFTNQIRGETLFLRGLYYFILANEFKDVPLRLVGSQDPETFPIPKSSQSDVYAQVESDLQTAAGLLTVEPLNNGRATKGAAWAFLGKMYIYTERWVDAIRVLEPLTRSPYSYGLVADYKHTCDLEHEYNEESIFEITYQQVGSATDRWGTETVNTMMTSPLNRFFSAADCGGYDICNASEKLLNIMLSEPDKDGNYDIRAIISLAWDYPGCMYFNKPFTESISPVNQSKIFIRKNTYADYLDRDKAAESEFNEKAYRYSNVLLFLAEAYLKTGNKERAISYLNQIRNRANLNLLDSSTNETAVMNDIIKQRAIEFVREGERFYDLRRWGLLEQEIQSTTPERAGNFSRRYYYLPIPSKEIQTNPECIQAEGW